MPPAGLAGCSPELKNMIAEYADHETRCSMRGISREFRSLLTPMVFYSFTLFATETSIERLASISSAASIGPAVKVVRMHLPFFQREMLKFDVFADSARSEFPAASATDIRRSYDAYRRQHTYEWQAMHEPSYSARLAVILKSLTGLRKIEITALTAKDRYPRFDAIQPGLCIPFDTISEDALEEPPRPHTSQSARWRSQWQSRLLGAVRDSGVRVESILIEASALLSQRSDAQIDFEFDVELSLKHLDVSLEGSREEDGTFLLLTNLLRTGVNSLQSLCLRGSFVSATGLETLPQLKRFRFPSLRHLTLYNIVIGGKTLLDFLLAHKRLMSVELMVHFLESDSDLGSFSRALCSHLTRLPKPCRWKCEPKEGRAFDTSGSVRFES